jgi:hypothetical protein
MARGPFMLGSLGCCCGAPTPTPTPTTCNDCNLNCTTYPTLAATVSGCNTSTCEEDGCTSPTSYSKTLTCASNVWTCATYNCCEPNTAEPDCEASICEISFSCTAGTPALSTIVNGGVAFMWTLSTYQCEPLMAVFTPPSGSYLGQLGPCASMTITA